MSISIVQTSTPASATSTRSVASSFGSLPAAGNTVIVCVWGGTTNNGAFGLTCADNQGNTYTLDKSEYEPFGGTACGFFRASNIGAPSGTFTVTISSSGIVSAEVVALEVSGLSNSGQPEVTPTGNQGSGTSIAPGSMTTTNAVDLVLAIVGTQNSISASPSSPWASIHLDNSSVRGEAVQQITTATGAFNATWTASSTSYAVAQVAYKAAVTSFVLNAAPGSYTLTGVAAGFVAPARPVSPAPAPRRRWGQVKPPPGVQLMSGQSLARSLLGCWIFNEGGGTVANDLSQQAGAGTLTGSASWKTGAYGPCMDTTTSSGYLSLPSILPNLTGTTATFAIRVKIRGIGSSGCVLFGTNTGNSVFCQIGTAATTVYAFGGGPSTTPITVPSTVWADSKWHDLVWVARGSTGCEFWYDGRLLGTGVAAEPFSSGAKNFAIGAWLGGSSWQLDGQIDKAILWGRDLTPAEITSLTTNPYKALAPPGNRVAYFGAPASATVLPYAAFVRKQPVIGTGVF